MSTLIMLVVGFAATAVLWRLLQAPLANPVLLRANYRNEQVPTAVGFVAVVGYVAVVAGAGVMEVLEVAEDPVATASRHLILPAVLGFAVLGLFDDLAGSGHHRGFGGHVTEAGRGRITTGMLKLLGGGLVALAVVAALPRHPQPSWLVLDAALVALAANAANLFDRAPARTIKVCALGFAALAVATRRWSELAGTALALGTTAGLVGPELRERAMLGDTGANPLGAALGLGVVLTVARPWRVGILVVLLALNLASERVSFSAVIDSVRPLRWLDRLGSTRR